MGLSTDVIWGPYPTPRRRGMGRGYFKYASFVIHIIIVFSPSLGTNGYLSDLEKGNAIPRRYKSNDQEHDDTTCGSEYRAYFRAMGIMWWMRGG
jgi:hypothetical protein